MQNAIGDGYRSRMIDAHDLVEMLLSMLDVIEFDFPAQISPSVPTSM